MGQTKHKNRNHFVSFRSVVFDRQKKKWKHKTENLFFLLSEVAAMRSHTERESQATCNNDNDCTYIYVNTRHTWVCWCDSSLSCSCQERVPLPPALEHPIFPGAFHRDACLVLQNFPPKWKYFKEAKPFRWHIRLRWLHLLSFFLTGKKKLGWQIRIWVFSFFFFWKIHSSNRVFQLDKKKPERIEAHFCLCATAFVRARGSDEFPPSVQAVSRTKQKTTCQWEFTAVTDGIGEAHGETTFLK